MEGVEGVELFKRQVRQHLHRQIRNPGNQFLLRRKPSPLPPPRHATPKGHPAPGTRPPVPGPSSPDRGGTGHARAWPPRFPTTAVRASGLGSNLPNLPNLLNFWGLRRSTEDDCSPTTSPSQAIAGERETCRGMRSFQEVSNRVPYMNGYFGRHDPERRISRFSPESGDASRGSRGRRDAVG